MENRLVSCRGYFPMFTFDAYSLKCKSYIYGGCGRTANMYTSLEQCLSTCYHGNPVGKFITEIVRTLFKKHSKEASQGT